MSARDLLKKAAKVFCEPENSIQERAIVREVGRMIKEHEIKKTGCEDYHVTDVISMRVFAMLDGEGCRDD